MSQKYAVNPFTGEIEIISTGGSGGGTYTGSSPTTITVGGLPAGSAIAGETFTQILQDMLVPYINPTFSSFSITGQSTTVEVGTTISGSKSFAWAFTTAGNITANTMAILDVTGATTLASGLSLTSPHSVSVGSVQLTAPGAYSWKGQATNTNTVVFNSSNFTVNWDWLLYYGTSSNTTLNASQIQALSNSVLTNTKNATYSFVANNYKYFSWPDSLGSPTAGTGVKDTATGIAIDMATSADDPAYSNTQNGWSYALTSVTNVNGITTTYRTYRSRFPLASSVNIQVS